MPREAPQILTYRVKVRQKTFLWGGKGITRQVKSQLFLYFRVDDDGEQISLATLSGPNAAPVDFGTLQPGEAYTIQLDGITGIYAAVPTPRHTYVDCAVIPNKG